MYIWLWKFDKWKLFRGPRINVSQVEIILWDDRRIYSLRLRRQILLVVVSIVKIADVIIRRM